MTGWNDMLYDFYEYIILLRLRPLESDDPPHRQQLTGIFRFLFNV